MQVLVGKGDGVWTREDWFSMVLSLTHRADNFMFRLDGFRGGELTARNVLSSFDDLKFPGSQTSLKIGANLAMCDLTHPAPEPVADQRTLIHNCLALEVLVTRKGERFSNTVKRIDGLLLMLRPFTSCAYNSVGLVSEVGCQLPVRGHHLPRRMNLLAVTRRVCGDLGRFLPGTARAFEVLTNLLAPGTGSVEVFLRVALDLRCTAPPSGNFVSELAQSEGQLGLIDSRSELLRGEEALRLDGPRLAVVALGNVENDCVCVELWRDISIDGAGCIVLKLSGYKPARGLRRMIPAYAGLCVAFEFVKGNDDTLPVGFANTLIAAHKCRERDGLGS